MASDCNWRLEAISKAAKNIKKTSFVLKAGENTVGKKKGIHIRIPSVLCSREHCSIFLDGDKVTLKDTSRNGTYITYPKETKHYTGESTEKPLEQNDMISFGFNTASVYDVNDKNAFIYRLVKEQIETIDIDDSDDEEVAAAPNKDKFIEIDNKVIDIDSDSNSNYSGDEHFQNIEEMEEEESSDSSCMIENDDSYSDDYDESDDSIGSEDDDFVVRKTILKCATPTETIALDEDDDDVPEVVGGKPTAAEESNKVANGDVDEPMGPDTSEKDENVEKGTKTTEVEAQSEEKDDTGENEAKSENKDENEADSKEETVTSTENVTKSAEEDIPASKDDAKSSTDQTIDDETESKDDQKSEVPSADSEKPSTNSAKAGTSKAAAEKAAREDAMERLRQRRAEKTQKRTMYTNPQSIRKRRQTITEEDYNQRKLTKKLDSEALKLLKRERIAQIGEREKAAREAAAENDHKNRTPHNPKVKVTTVTRGDLLSTDMLALN